MENEQQQKRKRLIQIGVVVIILLLIIFLIWWFFFRQIETPTVNLTPTTPNREVTLPTQPPVEIEPAPVQVRLENELTVIARNFTERFGSYSNESNFQNLKDLFPLMTNSFKNSLNLNPDDLSADYIGVDTKVLNVIIDSQTATDAEVTVNTQRFERDATLTETILYQVLKLSFIKSGDSWLVSNAIWQ